MGISPYEAITWRYILCYNPSYLIEKDPLILSRSYLGSQTSSLCIKSEYIASIIDFFSVLLKLIEPHR